MDKRCDIPIQWDSIQQEKGMNYQYILPYGKISNTLYKVREARPKRIHILWFHLYREFVRLKSTQTQNRLVVSRGWEPEEGLAANEHEKTFSSFVWQGLRGKR